MNKQSIFSHSIIFYSLLLNGAVFWGIKPYGQSALWGLFSGVFCGVVLFILFCLILKNKNLSLGKDNYEVIFIVPLILLCPLIYALYTAEFAKNIPNLSQGYGNAGFVFVFIAISLLASLFASKKGKDSFCGMCILFLLPIVFPLFLTWFDFLGYNQDLKEIFVQNIENSTKYFSDGFMLFWEMFLLLPLFLLEKKESFSIKGAKLGFLIFVITLLFEGLKYLLYFGANGCLLIYRPDKTMLSSLPYVNLQELFLFSYYFSYMGKITLYCCVLSQLMKKLFCFFGAKNQKAEFLLNFILLICSYILSYWEKFQKIFFLNSGFFLCAVTFLTILLWVLTKIIVSNLKQSKSVK